jgi:hypothetical protein
MAIVFVVATAALSINPKIDVTCHNRTIYGDGRDHIAKGRYEWPVSVMAKIT